MAVFITNVCKFDGCGITFPSLGDLIMHIEDTHIDYDPKVVEQKEQAQPAAIPLSYILRFISEDARKESSLLPTSTGNSTTGAELKRKLAIKHHSYSISSSNRSNTPTCSEVDEDEMVVTESEDSNDSWTTEEFSSEFIMRYGSRHSGNGAGTPGNEKPFACPVPGCKKRYKNVNGIKYHSKNGHKKDGKVRKGYKCHCGKSYKTAQGLKNHALATHNSSAEPTNVLTQISANGGGSSIILPRSTSPSQSLGSLSPSSISNMSSSASSCHGGGNNIVHNSNNANVLQHLTNNNAGTAIATTTNPCNNIINSSLNSAINANGNSNSNGSGNGSLNLQATPNNQAQTQHLQQFASSFNNNNNNNNNPGGQHFQQASQQQQLQQQNHHHLHVHHPQNGIGGSAVIGSGNNTNTLLRSTIGLVSIKSSSNTTNTAATNLLAANAAANKILKLAAANAKNTVDIAHQHKLQQQISAQDLICSGTNNLNKQPQQQIVNQQQQQFQQQQGATLTTPTKITLPNFVNLGILAPATSPTKAPTQALTFSQQQPPLPSVQSSISNMKISTIASNTAGILLQKDKLNVSTVALVAPTSPTTINNNNNISNSNSNINIANVKNNVLVVETTATETTSSSPTIQSVENQTINTTSNYATSTTSTTTTTTLLPLTPVSPNGKNALNNLVSPKSITIQQQKTNNANVITETIAVNGPNNNKNTKSSLDTSAGVITDET